MRGWGERPSRDAVLERRWRGFDVVCARRGSVVSWSYIGPSARLSVSFDGVTGRLDGVPPADATWDLDGRPEARAASAHDVFAFTRRWAATHGGLDEALASDGHPPGEHPDEVALRRFVEWTRWQSAGALDPAKARLARRFSVVERLDVYRCLASDTDGRVAQLVDVAPGALLLAAELGVKASPGPEIREILLEGVRAGRRLERLLDEALTAFFTARADTHPRLATPESRRRVIHEQRRIVRLASEQFPAKELLSPLPVPLVPEDLPQESVALAAWLGTVRRAEELVAERRIDPGPAGGLLQLVMRHAGRALATTVGQYERDQLGLLAHLVEATNVTLTRDTSFKRVMRTAYDLHVNEWRQSQWPDELSLSPPELPLSNEPGVELRLFRTAGDLRVESEVMQHCVASHVPYALRGHAFGRADLDGKPVTFHLAPHGGRWVLVQAKGQQNRLLNPREDEQLARWIASLPAAPTP